MRGLRQAVADWMRRGDSRVVAVVGPLPARSLPFIAAIGGLQDCLGPNKTIGVIGEFAPFETTDTVRVSVCSREPGEVYKVKLRHYIQGHHRSDRDAVAFSTLDNVAVAEELKALTAAYRQVVIGADTEGLVRELAGNSYRGRARDGTEESCVLIVPTGGGQPYPLPLKEWRAATTWVSVPARCAGFLADSTPKLSDGSRHVSDEEVGRAAQSIKDALGAPVNLGLAREDMKKELESEGFDSEHAAAIADRITALL